MTDLTFSSINEVSLAYNACLILVVAAVVCGIVRWFHMCRPYDKSESFFYPARKIVSLQYFSTLLLVPYLINLQSSDAWLFAKCYLVIFIPQFGVRMFRSFFFFKETRWWERFAPVSTFSSLSLLVLFVFACLGGNVMERYEPYVVGIIALASCLLIAHLLYITLWLTRRIRDFLNGEYSNEDDFPIHFARTIVYFPLLFWVVTMIVFFANDMIVLAVFHLLLAVWCVCLLVYILHPHRSDCRKGQTSIEESIEQIRIDGEEIVREYAALDGESGGCEIPQDMLEQLEAKVRQAVVEERLYLNPNLNKKDLSKHIGTNRTYLSVVFRERFGSFYSFVNTLRMEHAIRYGSSNPGASQLDIATSSGFGSVRTYCRVKKLYEQGLL